MAVWVKLGLLVGFSITCLATKGKLEEMYRP